MDRTQHILKRIVSIIMKISPGAQLTFPRPRITPQIESGAYLFRSNSSDGHLYTIHTDSFSHVGNLQKLAVLL